MNRIYQKPCGYRPEVSPGRVSPVSCVFWVLVAVGIFFFVSMAFSAVLPPPSQMVTNCEYLVCTNTGVRFAGCYTDTDSATTNWSSDIISLEFLDCTNTHPRPHIINATPLVLHPLLTEVGSSLWISGSNGWCDIQAFSGAALAFDFSDREPTWTLDSWDGTNWEHGAALPYSAVASCEFFVPLDRPMRWVRANKNTP